MNNMVTRCEAVRQLLAVRQGRRQRRRSPFIAERQRWRLFFLLFIGASFLSLVQLRTIEAYAFLLDAAVEQVVGEMHSDVCRA